MTNRLKNQITHLEIINSDLQIELQKAKETIKDLRILTTLQRDRLELLENESEVINKKPTYSNSYLRIIK
ncbi:MAG: hypothetical protein EOM90_05705 [Alphaproteobacteria bacterium]|nr:hypothetical protein [Alphaproteobacteria bacterium]